MTEPAAGGPWVLVAPSGRAAELRPLVDAHAGERDVIVHEVADLPHPAGWSDAVPAGAAAVLVVGDRRRSPATVLPGLFVPDAAGDPVPAGWLPAVADVSRFVRTAVSVSQRRDESPVAVLGQRSARYQRLGDRMVRHLGDGQHLRWGAERVTREDLVRGLAAGLGAAVYLGHGRPSGWAAYRGLRAAHLAPVADEPLGALLSITCWTASRWRVGTSFCERTVLAGVAAAAVGAVRPVLHLDTTRVVVGLAGAWAHGVGNVAGLLRAGFLDSAGRPAPEASLFRLCGDPLASVRGAAAVTARTRAVFAPAPDWTPATGLAS